MRDGFWLARWLRARGIEAYVIHPAASRCHASTQSDDRRIGTQTADRPVAAANGDWPEPATHAILACRLSFVPDTTVQFCSAI
jgi:hypothetical protein